MKAFIIGFLITTILFTTAVVLSKEQTLPIFTNRYSEAYTAVASTPFPTNQAVAIKYVDLTNKEYVLLNEEVNTDSTNKIINAISTANLKHKSIYLLIDSPGGSVIDGAHIISAIQSSKVPVYTVCMELCASMAAMILEYGTQRYAEDRAIIMFHPASLQAMVAGELDKIVSRFSFLQRFINKMDQFVAARSGETYEAFKAKSMREYWIDAEDAANSKLIDSVAHMSFPNSSGGSITGSNKLRQHINLSW